MDNDEKKLSRYIDQLNAERKPDDNDLSKNPAEENLFETVRLVHSLKEPVLPEENYPKELAKNVAQRLAGKRPAVKKKRNWLLSVASIAAVLLMTVFLNSVIPFGNINMVQAMENAFKEVKAYHGILEIVEMNAEGTSTTQAKLEVWADRNSRYFIKNLEGPHSGLITVNNGRKKWQLRPDEKNAYIFSAFPDPYRYTFELGNEISDVKNALKTRAAGKEAVAGREADILEVTPQGGAPYKLWVDKETRLPLQKQSALQNALQYKVTYTKIEFIDTIPEKLMAYSLPDGFKELSTTKEQFVNNFIEAGSLAGFDPRIPASLAESYSFGGISVETESDIIKLIYTNKQNNKKIVIIENKADSGFEIASTAIQGLVGYSKAEIQSPVQEAFGILGSGSYSGMSGITSVRWQSEGLEFAVVTDASLDEIKDFISVLGFGEVRIPSENVDLFRPQVEVPVDMHVEENEQKSVDAGHSPWRLDPKFVAQVFVSLKISPEGIVGDYPIREDELKITYNDGTKAIVQVSGNKTPVINVYLKRLVRKDPTGIWTVVGYDPVPANK